MDNLLLKLGSLALVPLVLFGSATPPVQAEPVLPGLGEVDGWVDATGDQMFGNLDMDVNSLLFRSLALNADSAGNLQWDGDDVCVAGSTLAGCSGGGDITAVTAGTGLTGGGTAGAVTLGVAAGGITATELASNAVTGAKIADGSVATGDLAFDPATQAELDAHDHGLTVATASAVSVASGSSDVTIASITLSTPNACPGAENHRYLVTGSGYVRSNTGSAEAFAGVVMDSTFLPGGSETIGMTMPATNSYATYHAVSYLTSVQPGSHTFRLLDFPSVSGHLHVRATLTVEHLGWTGC